MKRSAPLTKHSIDSYASLEELLHAQNIDELASTYTRVITDCGMPWCVAAAGRLPVLKVVAEYGDAPPLARLVAVLPDREKLNELPTNLAVYTSTIKGTVIVIILPERTATSEHLWLVARTMHGLILERQQLKTLELQLAQRTHMLETMYELARDASLETSRDRLLQIAGLRLMAHAATSRLFIALMSDGSISQWWARGTTINPHVLRHLGTILSGPCTLDELSDQTLRETLRSERIELIAPIAVRERQLGVVGIGARFDGRPQQLDDSFLAAYVGALAVTIEQLMLAQRLIDHERLERELALARAVQQRLLPTGEHVHSCTTIEIAARIEPARHVSGDYYDIYEHNGKILCVNADVCGKGIAAALIMAHLHAAFHSLAPQGVSPAEILSHWNRLLVRHTEPGSFVTAAVVELDPKTRTLRYANAGHPHPIVITSEGKTQVLDQSALVLGIDENVFYQVHTATLQPRSILCLYSDGISEAPCDDGTEFGIGRLSEIIVRNVTAPVASIIDCIFESLSSSNAADTPHDDRTVVLLRLTNA